MLWSSNLGWWCRHKVNFSPTLPVHECIFSAVHYLYRIYRKILIHFCCRLSPLHGQSCCTCIQHDWTKINHDFLVTLPNTIPHIFLNVFLCESIYLHHYKSTQKPCWLYSCASSLKIVDIYNIFKFLCVVECIMIYPVLLPETADYWTNTKW